MNNFTPPIKSDKLFFPCQSFALHCSPVDAGIAPIAQTQKKKQHLAHKTRIFHKYVEKDVRGSYFAKLATIPPLQLYDLHI